MEQQCPVTGAQGVDQRHCCGRGADLINLRVPGLTSHDAASEETQRLGAVAHQQVLGLLVMIEHHPVVLASDTRLFVTAERRVRGMGVATDRKSTRLKSRHYCASRMPSAAG